jgi:hypothetical protein
MYVIEAIMLKVPSNSMRKDGSATVSWQTLQHGHDASNRSSSGRGVAMSSGPHSHFAAEFSRTAPLPTDDVELMQLAAHYVETDFDSDLDVQTYVQLFLSAKQAAAHNQPLWVVT